MLPRIFNFFIFILSFDKIYKEGFCFNVMKVINAEGILDSGFGIRGAKGRRGQVWARKVDDLETSDVRRQTSGILARGFVLGGKRGQVWVETVIYTLIGLAIIGLVLATALPKINAKKDEVIIEQSIEALGNINNKIYEVQRAAGNRRVINLEIRKGRFVIDMEEDSIYWFLDSSFQYSEKNVPVPLGRLNVTTRSKGGSWEIELKVKYNVDIQYGGKDFGLKQLDVAPTPYGLVIENSGKNEAGDIVINLGEA